MLLKESLGSVVSQLAVCSFVEYIIIITKKRDELILNSVGACGGQEVISNDAFASLVDTSDA